jgi:hypothetical protein
MAREKMLQWLVPFLVATGISAYANYTHNDKAIAERLTAVEVQQKNDQTSIQRVEVKMDRIDSKLDRLVEWALGK